jgi:deoxyadenosine/deoxycytidine kinase
MNKKIISIEGNIGSGKSTLIKELPGLLSNSEYSVIILPEPVDQWATISHNGETILEKYYKDKKKYSFSFQMMAFITRLSQLKQAVKNAPDHCLIITERSVFTDRDIFARMLYDTGFIEPIEYQIYLRWFDEFISEFDFIGCIYVNTDEEICAQRIENRHRKGEDIIPIEYLRDLTRYHEQSLGHLNPLRINNNENWKTIPDDIVKKIKDYIEVIFH